MSPSQQKNTNRPVLKRRPVVAGDLPPTTTVVTVTPSDPSPRFLSRKQLCEKLSITFPYIWQLIRRGEFPPGREIGSKPVWLESEVNAWMSSRPLRQYKSREVA